MNEKSRESHRYDDMVDLPRHVSHTRPPMSMIDRAAQFSPFAALTGYDAALQEAARLTETRVELDEDRKSMLDRKLQMLRDLLAQRPQVTITHFVKDERKSGGSYVRVTGEVKKIDADAHTVVMMDRTTIPIEQIYEIESKRLNDV